MYFRTFDIFAGFVNNQPLWLESARGLEFALVRMHERSQHAPGQYFVFDSMTQTVLALVDSSTEHRLSKAASGEP